MTVDNVNVSATKNSYNQECEKTSRIKSLNERKEFAQIIFSIRSIKGHSVKKPSGSSIELFWLRINHRIETQ
jgi:hypothetical protein